MKNFWLKMANKAAFRANNNLEGLSSTDDIRIKYNDQIAAQAARLFNLAAYCLERYNNAE